MTVVAATRPNSTGEAGRPVIPVPGPIRFARYAYGPNRLGYCGPDAAQELLGEAAEGGDLRRIRELAAGFEGAYPYLRLIAHSNGIADPLDDRVVEAYWLGSELLDRVPMAGFARSIETRFKPRVRADAWRWLATKAPEGARPVHAFHVLDIFPAMGLLRGENVKDVLSTIDSCRIRWGRVRERIGGQLLVDAVPLELVNGRLRLGAPRLESIRGWEDGLGFVTDSDTRPGDVLAIHWDWACERLDARGLRHLQRWTNRQLEIANHTI
jgi:hypothetical protein